MKQTKTKIEQKMRIKLNLKYIIQINNNKKSITNKMMMMNAKENKNHC